MNIVTRYQCQYCKKELKKDYAMTKHEARCLRNEEKRACVTCNNFRGDPDHKWKCLINADEFMREMPYWPDGEPACEPYPTYLCSQWVKRDATWSWWPDIRQYDEPVPF